jgi:hypothetical protein
MNDFNRIEMPTLNKEIIHLARINDLNFSCNDNQVDNKNTIKMLNLDNNYEIFLKLNVIMKFFFSNKDVY